jgi:hypothetical protein
MVMIVLKSVETAGITSCNRCSTVGTLTNEEIVNLKSQLEALDAQEGKFY